MPFDPPKSDARATTLWELRAAAVLGFLGVAAGAFGAHALRAHVGADALQIWETGARYHLIHALAMLAVMLAPGASSPWRRRSARAFGVGVLIFAGTLYAMTLGAPRWFGAITPIGGVSLMLGWLCLLAPTATGPRASTKG